MKKTLLSIFTISISIVALQLLLTSSSQGRANAANSGNTGAPSESTTCRSCHGSGFSTTVSIVIRDSSRTPVSSYVPGAIYDAEFTVNATRAQRYGFQMVSLDSRNAPVNGFTTPAANTRLVTLGTGRQYAEHAGASVSNIFSVKWTAPASGTGNVTFYGGGAAVNNNRNTGGDGGNTTTLSLTENTTVGITEPTLSNELLIYPNPTRNVLNIENTSNLIKNTTAELYDVQGKRVFLKNLNLLQHNAEKLNVSELNSGYYVLRVSSGAEQMELKIMIQND